MGDNLVEPYTVGGPTELFLSRVTSSTNTTVVSLTAYLMAGSIYSLVIYADNGSGTSPALLLAQTSTQTASGTGWTTNTLIPSLPVSAGTYYWIGADLDSGAVGYSGGSGFPYAILYPSHSSGPPNNFTGSVVASGGKLSVYANGCPFIPLTATPTPTWTLTFTNSFTPTFTNTITNTPTGTWFTSTPTPTPTKTFTVTPTPT